jgi:hypothetical protein
VPIAVFLVLLGQSVVMAQYRQNEFAFGYTIEVDGAGAVYSVPVPYDVYADSVQDALADVLVFNGEGEIVPHEFRYAEVKVERQGTRANIPFFPLSSVKGAPADDLSIEIRRSSGGEIVNIEKRIGAAGKTARSYLLDLKNAGPYPVTLRLDWKTEGAGIMAPVILEGSHDLVHWHKVAQATLADLEFMGNKLHHGDVGLSTEPPRYLRLTMGPGGEAVRFTNVTAISEPRLTEKDRSWVGLPVQQVREEGRDYLKAELKGALPVDSLQVAFPRPNSILQARIHTRNSSEPWRFRTEMLFYELVENGITLKNEPVVMQRGNVQYFRLEVAEDGTGSGADALKLQVGYTPHDLVFIARGSGPFVLAYGNGRMKTAGPGKSRAEIHGLVGEKNKSIVRVATLGEKTVLGGEEKLERVKEPPWKKIVLWTVLLVGVVVLAAMAWSLTRKMNNADTP